MAIALAAGEQADSVSQNHQRTPAALHQTSDLLAGCGKPKDASCLWAGGWEALMVLDT